MWKTDWYYSGLPVVTRQLINLDVNENELARDRRTVRAFGTFFDCRTFVKRDSFSVLLAGLRIPGCTTCKGPVLLHSSLWSKKKFEMPKLRYSVCTHSDAVHTATWSFLEGLRWQTPNGLRFSQISLEIMPHPFKLKKEWVSCHFKQNLAKTKIVWSLFWWLEQPKK